MAKEPLFEPDWAVPPGATIAAIIEDRSISTDSFAAVLGKSVDAVQRLLIGLDEVDINLAAQLSKYLGSSQNFWINREAQYRADNKRIRKAEGEVSRTAWVKQFPIDEMVSFGWIGSVRSSSEAAEECLRFFGVPSVAAWQARYASSIAAATFRISASAKAAPGAVSAWLRWAELVAERISSAEWNAEAFRESLCDVRRLTWQKSPDAFLPKLRDLCARAGVAVVVARTPKGCPASGATRFLSPTKALMVLSFRYRSDDQFWFTFFHEAGHLLLHGPNALFLEDGSEATATEEKEANVFAEMTLVSPDFMHALLEVRPTTDEVLRLARRGDA